MKLDTCPSDKKDQKPQKLENRKTYKLEQSQKKKFIYMLHNSKFL